jgi:uncharacterized protein (TIGR03083 family)
MAGPSPWPTIHAERKALVEDLESLTDEQWATRSLCDSWTVQEVLAHMTAAAESSVPKFFGGLASAGFKFNNFTARDVAKRTSGSPADTLAGFKRNVTSVKHPPGPVDTWLGETIVHSEDIRRPLKIKHSYPADALIRLADNYRKSNLIIGGKRRVAGLTLRATDADWSAGSGPEVTGPLVSIVLAMTGRSVGLKDLSGPGLPTLKSRM